jgi:GST-like protein
MNRPVNMTGLRDAPCEAPVGQTPCTLYGSFGSGAAAVEMALRAASVRYEAVRVSSWEPGPPFADLLAIHPLGQVPVLLLPDGTVMSESAAILIHLGLTCPEAELLPTSSSARATAIRGLVHIAANCYAAVSVSDHPDRWTTATSAYSVERVRGAARRQLHRAWEVFADQFGGNAEFQGGSPGCLAFLCVVVSQWSGARAHLREHRPAFFQAIQRLEQHPRIEPVLREHRTA